MMRSKAFLALEFILLCLAVPGYIIFNHYAPFMFAFLWGATLYCYAIIRAFYFKGWRDLWKWEAVTWPHMKPILARWMAGVIGMAVFLYFYDKSNYFSLWHTRPQMIPYIMLLYPVLSALPQEFIFCNFFFKRYEPFFGRGQIMVLASAFVFCYVHFLYLNPVAPVLSFVGGLIFAHTYQKHHSLALVTIEHSLYGNALFLIGLGPYFFSGQVSG